MGRALGFVFVIDKPLALRYAFVSTTARLEDGRLDVVSVMKFIHNVLEIVISMLEDHGLFLCSRLYLTCQD